MLFAPLLHLFSAKASHVPPFPALAASPIKDKYFVRKACWSWLKQEHIFVYDPHGPRLITMDPWPQLIFLAALGNQTVENFVYNLASKYKGQQVPAKLDETVLSALGQSLELDLIKLVDTPETLPKEFAQPR